ncbi:MAG: hypothetical protein ACXWLH_03485 [Candidatus Saccharimonadales bacterium]
MDAESRLQERAQEVVNLSHELLLLPDNVQLMQEHHSNLGNDYSITVRSGSITFTDKFDAGPLRFIYLNGPHEADNCRPYLSLNLYALINDGEVKGMLDQPWCVEEFREAVQPGQEIEQELLTHLSSIVLANERYETIRPEKAQILDAHFQRLLALGSLVTRKFAHKQHEDETHVHLRSMTLEGTLENLGRFEVNEPRLKIEVHKLGDVNHTVLEEMRTGKIETFTEIANGMERAATYAKPEDVIRDKEGKIAAVLNSLDGLPPVISAARAMGLRDLRPEYLDVVEYYVRETFQAA